MYTIITVVYGVPLTPELISLIEAQGENFEDVCDLEELDIYALYRGSGTDIAGYIGVYIEEFDDIKTSLAIDAIRIYPTADDMNKWDKIVKALPKPVQDEIRGKEKIYFIFSHS